MENPQADLQETIELARDALLRLARTSPDIAGPLARVVTAVAREAAQSPKLARALAEALDAPAQHSLRPRSETVERRHGRRAPGPIDPFAVFTDIGEDGLRQRLADLSVEQLRDIVAEQRMDHDRLAMKWKDPARLSERIVDLVKSRSVKGEVFRPD